MPSMASADGAVNRMHSAGNFRKRAEKVPGLHLVLSGDGVYTNNASLSNGFFRVKVRLE